MIARNLGIISFFNRNALTLSGIILSISIMLFYPATPNAQLASDMQEKLLVSKDHIWPRLAITVCWRDFASTNSSEAELVHHAVDQYLSGDVSLYRFNGWLACDNTRAGRIEISVTDEWPQVAIPGYQTVREFFVLHEAPTLMRLNFSFQNRASDTPCASTDKKRCIQTIAVHEFMHALGALHEQANPNLQKLDLACYKLFEQENKDVSHQYTILPLTVYDPDSIMNYCRNIYSEDTRLSDKDIQGLRSLAALTLEKMK